MVSPKGEFRMWHFALVGVLFMGFSASQGVAGPYVWFWETIAFIGRVGAGAALAYWGARHFIHTRTHELSEEQRFVRENFWIVGWCVIVCGIFISL